MTWSHAHAIAVLVGTWGLSAALFALLNRALYGLPVSTLVFVSLSYLMLASALYPIVGVIVCWFLPRLPPVREPIVLPSLALARKHDPR